jgi:deoxyribose-phosphate aldolase
MQLTSQDIAKMIDLSCVRTTSSLSDIEEMVNAAKQYGFGQVSVMQCFLPQTLQMIKGAADIRLIGNVSFPSGSNSTSTKVFQAKEMVAAGCDEIDMVMNIGKLRSGFLRDVENDVRSVLEVVKPLPLKVIIEIMVLTPKEVQQACEICIRTGASFVKTGTGWADRGTKLEDVQLIRSFVGDQIKIKASGGIRSVDSLVNMYRAGARRFGINLKSGIQILDDIIQHGNQITV